MKEDLRVNYLLLDDICMLEKETDIHIIIDGEVNTEAFSEAIRTLIERGRFLIERR